ncbi:uncharacterized protein LOC121865186 isoform X2 [Homarus americanus]|uniref:Putative hemolymph juvenile hormone binding protein JHBP-like 2 n=1 Tax=Homarus americanus TaxID=6706 RepID=A0A8J5K3G4_HOMAM|nr:uncharacterized protein LOC121865186 isoform X2 [Homarus americanus]KAG7169892.1 putative hemolymph juvenile hormone binding protein JHBP-like 2 [Homarus americanus]
MKVLLLVGVLLAAHVYCLLADPYIYSVEEIYEVDYFDYEEDDAEAEEEWRVEDLDEESVGWIGNIIRDAIIDILEDIREGMVTGFPELGIPPLDPLVIDSIPYNVSWDNNTVYGNMSGSELVDLATFQTAKVLVNVFGLSVDIGLLLDALELHGAYVMDGRALDLHVFGDGAYHIKLNEITLSFFMKLGLGKYVSVKEMTADFTLKSSKVQFEHLMNGGITGALINEALSVELPKVLGVMENLVIPPLMDLLQNRTNEFLRQYPIIPDFNITDIYTD